MKKIWIFVCVCVILGIVLIVTGLALGAKTTLFFDGDRFYTDYVHTKTGRVTSEAFEDIKIEMVYADIELVQSDFYGYDIDVVSSREVDVYVEGETLEIKERNNWIGFGFFNYKKHKAKVIVYYPKESELQDVSIDTVSGDIKTGALVARDVLLDTVSGDLELFYVECESIKINTVSGELNIDGGSAASLSFNSVSGDAELEGFFCESASFSSVSGDFELDCDISNKITINSVSGDCSLRLRGGIEDYHYDIDTNGSSKIAGKKYKNGMYFNKSSVFVKFDSTSGDLDIVFR